MKIQFRAFFSDIIKDVGNNPTIGDIKKIVETETQTDRISKNFIKHGSEAEKLFLMSLSNRKEYTIEWLYVNEDGNRKTFKIYPDDPDEIILSNLYKYISKKELGIEPIVLHIKDSSRPFMVPHLREKSFPFDKVQPNVTLSSLNMTHKNILDGFLYFLFEELSTKDNSDAINVLEAILLYGRDVYYASTWRREINYETELPSKKVALYKRLEIWENFVQIIDIFRHHYPQNRSENAAGMHPPSDPSLVIFRDKSGKAAFEKKGLLSLTARSDAHAPPINKRIVIEYIESALSNELVKRRQRVVRANELKEAAEKGHPEVVKAQLTDEGVNVTEGALTRALRMQSLHKQTEPLTFSTDIVNAIDKRNREIINRLIEFMRAKSYQRMAAKLDNNYHWGWLKGGVTGLVFGILLAPSFFYLPLTVIIGLITNQLYVNAVINAVKKYLVTEDIKGIKAEQAAKLKALNAGVDAKHWKGYLISFKDIGNYTYREEFRAGMIHAISENEEVVSAIRKATKRL